MIVAFLVMIPPSEQIEIPFRGSGLAAIARVDPEFFPSLRVYGEYVFIGLNGQLPEVWSSARLLFPRFSPLSFSHWDSRRLAFTHAPLLDSFWSVIAVELLQEAIGYPPLFLLFLLAIPWFASPPVGAA